MKRKIFIAGGGTGGHVFPALAMADEFSLRGYEIVYVGSYRGLEAKLAPEHNVRFVPIKTGQIKNQSPPKLALGILKTFLALIQCFIILLKERPKAIIGVGGYVSVPVCLAGYFLRIPLFLQEQNVSVGIANRFLGRFARQVFLGFEQARKYFRPKQCLVTGNPIRRQFFDARFDQYQSQPLRIFIFGGSQGAQAINTAIVELLGEIKTTFPNVSILHQTGQRDFSTVDKKYQQLFHDRTYEVLPFVQNIADEYARASVVISRSGALTVSELMAVKRPSILIPYPRAGQNDQTANAYFLESKRVARVVEQGEDFKSRLWNTLKEVCQQSQLQAMASEFSGLQRNNPLATIGDQVENALQA